MQPFNSSPVDVVVRFCRELMQYLLFFREMADLDQLQMTETHHKQNEIVDGLRKVDGKGLQQHHRVSSKYQRSVVKGQAGRMG